MKKKFASFLVTGKAATLPFLASSSFANDSIAFLEEQFAQSINAVNQNATRSSVTTMSIVVTGMHDGDDVFVIASNDKDAPEYLAIDTNFRMGKTNFQVLDHFRFNASDFSYDFQVKSDEFGNATYTLSVPVDLSQFLDSEEFYIQAVIVKPDGSWIFSELDRTTRRMVRGNCGDPYGNPPVALFTFTSPSSAPPPLNVYVDASNSYDPNGSIVGYEWSIGGQTSSGSTTFTRLNTPGTYPVVLTVTDNDGCRNSTQQNVEVINTPPVADFTLSSTNGVAPLTVNMNAGPSYDTDGSIVNYEWSVNGQILSGSNVSTTFHQAGEYPIILTVTDNHGATAIKQGSVRVDPPIHTGGGDLTFTGTQSFYKIGDFVNIKLTSNFVPKNRFENVDLWLAIQLPTGDLLFMTPLGFAPFSPEPQPFKESLGIGSLGEGMVFDILSGFEVAPGFGGEYIFYAAFIQEGKNPLTDGFTVMMSSLAKAEMTLENQ